MRKRVAWRAAGRLGTVALAALAWAAWASSAARAAEAPAQEVKEGPPVVTFAFRLDKAGPTSAGVFDGDGRLVRVLWTMKDLPAGKHEAGWDGLDGWGEAAPAGAYTWRVVRNGSVYRNVGVIGNSGLPPDDKGHTPNNLQSVACDAAGAVYTANYWDEAGADFKKWDAAGNSVYDARYQIRNGNPNGAPYAITTDEKYLYCTMGGWKQKDGAELHQVQRFLLADGKHVPFPGVGRKDGHITIYETLAGKVPEDAPEEDAWRLRWPLRAVAIQGDLILVADLLGNRILRFQKETGEAHGEFAVSRPEALAVDAAGRIWVGHEKTLVTRFTRDGAEPQAALKDLGRVESLYFGPKGELCVADGGACQVRVYDVAGAAPKCMRTLGRKAEPGDWAPDRFYTLRGAAMDKDGNLFTINKMPVDGSRLAKWSADGKCLWERQGLEFVSLGNYGREDPDTFYSMTFGRYRLGARDGGAWEYRGSMWPGGTTYRSDTHGTPRVLRIGKADFYFMPTGDGVQVYRIEKNVLRPAAMVGGRDPTTEGRGRGPKADAMWTWSDASGDGKVDADEIRWFRRPDEKESKHVYATFGMDVDQDGNVWTPNHHTRSLWTIPRGPSDARGNPTYDWAKAVEAVKKDASALALEPNMCQRAEDGSIYAFGWSAKVPRPKDNPFWMGGNTLARFDKAGERLWAVALPDTVVGLDTVPGGGCMVGIARKAHILHYTADGLLVGRLEPGEAMGKVSGWLDNQASVAVNRDPRDKRLDVFVEEDYALRIAWYRVDDRDQRTTSGTLKRP